MHARSPIAFYAAIAGLVLCVSARTAQAQQSLAPRTPMPSYHRIAGLADVAPAWRGRPLLTAGEVEDIVAYLSTLR